MNTICAEQNSERELDRLAAQRSLYSTAKQIFAVHAALSTLVAALFSLAALFFGEVKPYAALWGGLLTVLDIFWLTPWQKKLREKAATIQESFDCAVLGLPWQALKAGKTVDPELVAERASMYRRTEPSFASLRDWYPSDVGGMPPFLARVACQRTNAWWDGKQRRRYAFLLIAVAVALLIGLLALGIARQMRVADLLMTAVVPLLSGLVLAMRQFKEHQEAADRLDKIKDHASDLWNRGLAGAREDEVAQDSRVLQDELFDHRKRNVPVFDWLYGRLRSEHETQMKEAAAQMRRELENARRVPAGKSPTSAALQGNPHGAESQDEAG